MARDFYKAVFENEGNTTTAPAAEETGIIDKIKGGLSAAGKTVKDNAVAGWNKAKEHAGAAKEWVEANPGKASAIGAATAAGLGALAFRKKIAEKLRKNK